MSTRAEPFAGERLAVRGRSTRLATWFLLLLPWALVLAFVVWGLRHTSDYARGWDEGTILLSAREIARGVQLYEPMWWNYPPVYLWQIAAVMRLTAESVEAARALAVLWSGVTILATAMLARRAAGAVAGAVAALYLVLAPSFVEYTRPVMMDIPMVALLLLAFWVMVPGKPEPDGKTGRNRAVWWAALAGILAALAGLTKLTAAPFLPALGLAWYMSTRPNGEWKRAAAFLLGGLLTVALVLSRIPLRPFVDQVLLFNAAVAGGGVDQPASPLGNAAAIWRFLALPDGRPLFPFVLLALAGIWPALLEWRERPAGAVLLVAFLGAAAALLSHAPLHSHLLVVLQPPLAVLAGIGAAWLLARVLTGVPPAWRLPVLGGAAVAALLLAGLARPDLTYTRLASFDGGDKARDGRELAADLRRTLPPGAVVLSDDPMITFLSGHRPPPTLVNVADLRFIENGDPAAPGTLSALEGELPEVVIFWTDRFLELPGMLPWVQERYELAGTFGSGGERRLYRRLEPLRFEQRFRFGERLALRDYDLDRVAVSPGETVTLTLGFQDVQAEAPGAFGTMDFYVHLDDVDGRRIAGGDRAVAPVELRGPQIWLRGDQIRREVALSVAPDAPPGLYRFHVGAYDSETREVAGEVVLDRPVLVGGEAELFERPNLQHPSDAEWPGLARLLGADVRPDGETVEVTLYWQARATPSQDAHVFVHLVDEQGTLAAQSDSVPAGGLRPLGGWLPGEVIVDRHRIVIPAGLAPGDFTLKVGLYDPGTLERLPAVGSAGPLPDHAASLPEVSLP